MTNQNLTQAIMIRNKDNEDISIHKTTWPFGETERTEEFLILFQQAGIGGRLIPGHLDEVGEFTPLNRYNIQTKIVDDEQRLDLLPTFFGFDCVNVENTIYRFMRLLTPFYDGGFWEFMQLSNGGFYMYCTGSGTYQMEWEMNGFSGEVSNETAGIIVTLFTLSNLSMYYYEKEKIKMYEKCCELHWKLYDYAKQLDDYPLIRQAID